MMRRTHLQKAPAELDEVREVTGLRPPGPVVSGPDGGEPAPGTPGSVPDIGNSVHTKCQHPKADVWGLSLAPTFARSTARVIRALIGTVGRPRAVTFPPHRSSRDTSPATQPSPAALFSRQLISAFTATTGGRTDACASRHL